MTRNCLNFHRRGAHFGALAAFLLALGGCASTPPPTDRLGRAQAALSAAVDAGAKTWAPLELGFAQDRLDQANAAVAARKNDLAADLADESLANSDLARVKSELGKLREENKKAGDENARLRAQLLGDDGSAAPAAGGGA
jgi:hypothetical protein